MTYCKSAMSSSTSPREKWPNPRTLRKLSIPLMLTLSSRRYVKYNIYWLLYFITVFQILRKGELQVGEKEREHDLASLRREIATQVSEKCVDPATKRPYPVGIIEKAMNEVGFSVKLNKNAKSQVQSTTFFPCYPN